MGDLMADKFNPRQDRYANTPRKIFDKHVDRMHDLRVRDKEDHRADMKALLQRLVNLETQLSLLMEHVDRHCAELFADKEHGDTRDS